MRRLELGCKRLGIALPDAELLLDEVSSLVGKADTGTLKLIITRGQTERGYASTVEMQPDRILYFWQQQTGNPDPVAEGAAIRTCQYRLAINPQLAGLKHLNRLDQVLARSEWSNPDIFEGLMLDYEGYLVEGTMSNVFIRQGNRLVTPSLDRCGVAGVVRQLLMDTAVEMGQPVEERRVKPEEIRDADALYLTNSLFGIVPVRALDTARWDKDSWAHPVLQRVEQQIFSP